MNRYWNEYRHVYINKDIEYKISKIFQFSLEYENHELEQKEIIENLQLKNIKYPDIVLERFEFEKLPLVIKDIFQALKMVVSYNEYLLFIPVLVIHSDLKPLETGVYMIDVINGQLLLTGNEVSPILERFDDSIVTLHWFLDLESTVAMFNNCSVFEGTKHVVKNQVLFNSLLEKNSTLESKEFKVLQAQKLSKDLGLNARLCILLGNNVIK